MLSMRRNHELFWLFEILLLTPVVFFWLGVVSIMLSGSNNLLLSVVGEPMNTLRSVFIVLICPAAAAWFASEYIRENKNEKGAILNIARAIIWVSLLSIVLVLVYLYGENKPR